MSATDESRTLKRRAEIFLKHSEEALEREEYDFSCFSAEQAMQLYLKSLALELLGEIPRIHRVRELLSVLADAIDNARSELRQFARENRDGLRVLEESYIGARYLPLPYTREDAESALDLAKRAINLCERLLGRRL